VTGGRSGWTNETPLAQIKELKMKKIIILSINFLLCGCRSYQEITE